LLAQGNVTAAIAVNGNDTTATAGTATVLIQTATTLNIGGAATSLLSAHECDTKHSRNSILFPMPQLLTRSVLLARFDSLQVGGGYGTKESVFQTVVTFRLMEASLSMG